MKPELLPLSNVADALASGAVSPEALLEASLGRIRARTGACTVLTPDGERGAHGREGRRSAPASGKPLGPLDGVPIALKDIFCMEGVETPAARRSCAGYAPPYDATVVRRAQAGGAIIVGS